MMEKDFGVITLKKYDEWWLETGSGMAPYQHEDYEEFVQRICREAWFKATKDSFNTKEECDE